MKYRKKPVVIEAIQWSGNISQHREVMDFVKEHSSNKRALTFNTDRDNTLTIKTLEGDHIANRGDFIICGVKGELYPCKPDIFEMTSDEVKE